ncbi:hypothetical protein ACQ4PT_068909 [Festuca glaucescens]
MDQCLQVALVAGTDAIATQSNFIFSPLSLRAALAVLAAGTKGETLRELLTFLGSQELHLLNATSAGLIAEMRSWPQLSFAAGIFADRSLSLRPDFVSTASSAHGAFGRSLDFQNQPEAAAAEVNAFIAKTTRGCLRDLVSAGTFKGDTKIVLANAMHFKATWAARRFDPSDTVRSQFNRLDGTSLRVPFLSDPGMQYADSFEDLGFKVLQCFYKMVGRDGKLDPKAPFFSMLIFLPHRRDGLSDLLRGCDLPSPSQTLSCAALPGASRRSARAKSPSSSSPLGSTPWTRCEASGLPPRSTRSPRTCLGRCRTCPRMGSTGLFGLLPMVTLPKFWR